MTTRCPTCGAPVLPASAARPFCSPRCRLVDLGRWLGEEFRIPAVDDDADPTPPPYAPVPREPAPRD